MTVSKRHSSIRKVDRKEMDCFEREGKSTFSRVDMVVDKIYKDICKGVAKSEIFKKLDACEYGNNAVGRHQQVLYYNAAFDRCHFDSDIENEKLREMLFARYEKLLLDATEKGDVYNARCVLDSMAKVFGIGARQGDTLVQINGGKDGITVNFGFGNNNDEKSEDVSGTPL